MNPRRRSLLILGAFAFAAVVSGCAQPGPTVANQASVYSRVIKNGSIRAAYLSYPPAVMKDTRSGQLSGAFVDVLNKIGENTGLKIEWAEEVPWGAQIEGLNNDRYDIVGSPVWANPTRGKLTTLSRPVFFSGIGIYVRQDDKRLAGLHSTPDGGWAPLNSDQVRIATIDGETGDLIARTQFPLAKRVSLPQTADISQLFLQVATNKADVIFAEPYFALEYLKHNPKNIINIAADRPIRVLGNCFMFKSNEFQLKQLIDTALEDLINSGYVDQVLAKYEGGETFYRVGPPYALRK